MLADAHAMANDILLGRHIFLDFKILIVVQMESYIF